MSQINNLRQKNNNIMQETEIGTVQEMLGHESITTTEIYTHLDREYLRSAILQFHPRSEMNKKSK